MNRSSNRSTHMFASLALGATVALTGCAQDSVEGLDGLDGEETLAETSQALTGVWEWKDVPGTACANGSQTGFGINVGTSGDIVVYLEGGGFCWDQNTCGLGLASHVSTGYDGAKFASVTLASGIFDKKNPANPYRNSTIVYIPYCTGDYHSGDNVKEGLQFKGRVNLALDMAVVKAQFPNPSRVTLTGSSAGGFGSFFNYGSVAETFAGTRVDLVTDSAPVLWYGGTAIALAPLDSWKARDAFPAGCTACKDNPRALYRYYSTTYPNSRFAFVGFDQDPTMSAGYTVLPFLYTEELRKLAFELATYRNWKHFVAPGAKHTTMYDIAVATQNKKCNWFFGLCFPANYGPTTNLATFLTKMYTDDPTWAKQSSLIE